MSMSTLSTELDTKIAEYLAADEARDSLGCLSRVSKYYRNLMEPVLYRHLSFSVYDTWCNYRIVYLLFTLLDRNELAKHIKSFMLISEPAEFCFPNKLVPDIADKLWSYASLIQSKIREISGKLLPSGFMLEWFSNVLVHRPALDGALALILCMATNIEVVHLCSSRTESITKTQAIMRHDWRNVPLRGRGHKIPFRKMVDLCFEGVTRRYSRNKTSVSLTVTAPIEVLRVKNCRIYTCQIAQWTDSGNLHTFELTNANFQGNFLEVVASTPCFRNLRQLIVRSPKMGVWSTSRLNYDFRRLQKIIETHLLHLEVFQCTNLGLEAQERPTPFDTFKNLKNLVELRIDIQLLISTDTPWRTPLKGPAAHEKLIALLPPKLRCFELHNFEINRMDALLNELCSLDDGHSYASDWLANTVQSFPLKEVKVVRALGVWHHSDPNDTFEMNVDNLQFLQYVADKLMEDTGVLFQVLKRVGQTEKDKLLAAPDCMALETNSSHPDNPES